MSKTRFITALAAATLMASPAFAHLDPVEHGSFAAGFSHPLFGLDHIITMVAVGMWAATLGRRAMIAMPTAFVSAMIVGFALALVGLHLPAVEPMILASVITLGVLVALAVKVRVALGVAIVALFGIFHGYAHGGELGGAGAFSFGVGFAIATALLHIAGIGLGLVIGRSAAMTRISGAIAAAAGVFLAVG